MLILSSQALFPLNSLENQSKYKKIGVLPIRIVHQPFNISICISTQHTTFISLENLLDHKPDVYYSDIIIPYRNLYGSAIGMEYSWNIDRKYIGN